MRRRSALGVMTAKSGSQPQNGQWPCVHDERSTRCHQDLGAAREERPQREHEHLIEARRRAGGAARPRRADPTSPCTTARRAARARCRRARASTIASWSAASSASNRRRMSAVCRSVSRKSVQSSGMSPKRTSGAAGGLLLRAATPRRPESTAAARATARAAASRRARAACRRPSPAPAGRP